jgi:ArsR family metal-binding transcriptional regulator
MNPEEIQEQMSVLEQRINQRVQFLSTNDPQTQRLVGQMEVYKALSEEPIKEEKQ